MYMYTTILKPLKYLFSFIQKKKFNFREEHLKYRATILYELCQTNFSLLKEPLGQTECQEASRMEQNAE